jgi:hypothetical protein
LIQKTVPFDTAQGERRGRRGRMSLAEKKTGSVTLRPILCETLRLPSATSAYRLLQIARRCLEHAVPSAGPLSPGDSPGQSVDSLFVTATFLA